MNQHTDTDEGFIPDNIWDNRFGDSVKIITVFESGGALVRVSGTDTEYVVDCNGRIREDRLCAGDLISHHYVVGFGNVNRKRNFIKESSNG
jgi:hypothetical protein